MNSINKYWKQASAIGKEVYTNRSMSNVDEQAGPAYFDGLALSRWIFWRRLKLALQEIPIYSEGTCVDFGCGFGLALPLLRERFDKTIGVDLVPDLARDFMRRWDATHGGHRNAVSITDSLDESVLAPGSVDFILALDVLEHFKSLEGILKQIHGLLKPNGEILITGPTENIAYRIGRKIVGFTGEYHHLTIYDVLREMSKTFEVRVIRRIPAALPLFLVAKAVKR